jgi:transposase
VPERFGPWQTVWKRHRRYSGDGTWDRILSALMAYAQKVELIDWAVSVESTINPAHLHAANFPRHTGGANELHESAHRAG